MAKIKGICKNIDGCDKAVRGEEQEVEQSAKFECEECGKPLVEVKKKGGTKDGPNKLLIGIIAAIVIIGGGAGGYFALKEKPVKTIVVETPASKPAPILVSSLTLEKTSLTLKENASAPLSPTIQPDSAANKSVEWSSSDATIATVDANGKVTAIKEGSAIIQVKTKDGSNLSATSTVNVQKESVQKPPVIASDPKTRNEGGTGTGTVNVPGGVYKGELKNGKPDGNGSITYHSRTRISPDDMKERYANAGDRVTGLFSNGKVVQVTWYNADGSINQVVKP